MRKIFSKLVVLFFMYFTATAVAEEVIPNQMQGKWGNESCRKDGDVQTDDVTSPKIQVYYDFLAFMDMRCELQETMKSNSNLFAGGFLCESEGESFKSVIVLVLKEEKLSYNITYDSSESFSTTEQFLQRCTKKLTTKSESDYVKNDEKEAPISVKLQYVDDGSTEIVVTSLSDKAKITDVIVNRGNCQVFEHSLAGGMNILMMMGDIGDNLWDPNNKKPIRSTSLSEIELGYGEAMTYSTMAKNRNLSITNSLNPNCDVIEVTVTVNGNKWTTKF